MFDSELNSKTYKPHNRSILDNSYIKTNFTYTLLFINETISDITVVMRDNLPILYDRQPPTGAASKQIFTIRKIYQFENFTTIQELLNNLYLMIGTERDQLYPDDLQIIYERLLEIKKYNPYCRLNSVTIDRFIDFKEINEASAIYLNDVDVMLYHGRFSTKMLHPFSLKAKTLESFKNINTASVTSGTLVEIVTHDHTLNHRYVQLLDMVFKIPNTVDNERPEGFYITRIINGQVSTEFKTIEEMDDIGVYKSFEEAKDFGQTELNRRKELESLKHEHDVLKYENDKQLMRLKNAYDKIKLEFDVKSKELEEEKQRSKYTYEKQSYQHKSVYEAVKTVPSIVLGIIGLYTVFRKVGK